MAHPPFPVPQNGTTYSITLGETLKPNKNKNTSSYHSMLYQFKPHSINEHAPGVLQYSVDDKEETGTLLAEFSSAAKGDETILLSGQYAKAKDTECILIFDGNGFRLEQLEGKVHGLKKASKVSSQSSEPTILKRRANGEIFGTKTRSNKKVKMSRDDALSNSFENLASSLEDAMDLDEELEDEKIDNEIDEVLSGGEITKDSSSTNYSNLSNNKDDDENLFSDDEVETEGKIELKLGNNASVSDPNNSGGASSTASITPTLDRKKVGTASVYVGGGAGGVVNTNYATVNQVASKTVVSGQSPFSDSSDSDSESESDSESSGSESDSDTGSDSDSGSSSSAMSD